MCLYFLARPSFILHLSSEMKFYGVEITIDVNNTLKFYFFSKQMKLIRISMVRELDANQIEKEMKMNFVEFCKIIMTSFFTAIRHIKEALQA